jgi:hypothetical protein
MGIVQSLQKRGTCVVSREENFSQTNMELLPQSTKTALQRQFEVLAELLSPVDTVCDVCCIMPG